MNELDVHIVQLEPIRVAAAHGFGTGPEAIAWDKINAYIEKTGLAKAGQPLRFFGFNNPDPSPGSPNYGYEQWVVVGEDAEPAPDIEIKDFGGGLYAVTRTTLVEIGQKWQELLAWRERSPYRFGSHQWLEEMMTWQPDGNPGETNPETVVLDLYMPVEK